METTISIDQFKVEGSCQCQKLDYSFLDWESLAGSVSCVLESFQETLLPDVSFLFGFNRLLRAFLTRRLLINNNWMPSRFVSCCCLWGAYVLPNFCTCRLFNDRVEEQFCRFININKLRCDNMSIFVDSLLVQYVTDCIDITKHSCSFKRTSFTGQFVVVVKLYVRNCNVIQKLSWCDDHVQ